jgi:hypothetical protein
MAKRKTATASSVQFIVSDDKSPTVTVKPGMRLNVVSTVLVGPDLKRIRNIGARLCGGSGTCMALVDIGSDVINPAPKVRSGRGRGSR